MEGSAKKSVPIKAVVFDMDGTLVISNLDFRRIRSEAGVPDGLPVLEYMDGAPEHRRAHVQGVLERHELRAARGCRLRDGAADLLRALKERGLKVGLLTRNSRASVATFGERFGLVFDCCISREDAEPKPSPTPVLRMARAFGLDPAQVLVVGDYVFDVEAGKAAGARTAFLATDSGVEAPDADIQLQSLSDLIEHF